MKDLKCLIKYCDWQQPLVVTLPALLCLTTECTFGQAVYTSSLSLKAHLTGRGSYRRKAAILMNRFFLHSALHTFFPLAAGQRLPEGTWEEFIICHVHLQAQPVWLCVYREPSWVAGAITCICNNQPEVILTPFKGRWLQPEEPSESTPSVT